MILNITNIDTYSDRTTTKTTGYNDVVLQIQGDSELAINSLNKHYPPKDVALRRHWSLALALMRSLPNISPSHNNSSINSSSGNSNSSSNDSALLSVNLTPHDDVNDVTSAITSANIATTTSTARANDGTIPPLATHISSLRSVNLTHVSREHNEAADALATLAMTTQRSFSQYNHTHTHGHGGTTLMQQPPQPLPPYSVASASRTTPKPSSTSDYDPSCAARAGAGADPDPSSGPVAGSLGIQGLLYLSISTETIPLYLRDSFAMLALDICVPGSLHP